MEAIVRSFYVVEVEDLLEWLRILQNMRLQVGATIRFGTTGLSSSRWLFRGQSNAEWELETSLGREIDRRGRRDVKENELRLYEKLAIEEFQRKAYQYCYSYMPEVDDVVEWVGLMQHYGTPTRLLDFTESPLVALYFAAQESDAESFAVWAIRADERLRGMNDSCKSLVKKLEERARKSDSGFGSEDNRLYKELQEKCMEEFWRAPTLDGVMRSNVADANRIFIPKIRHFRGIRLPDMSRSQSVLALQLKRNNERMNAQAGLFLMPTTLRPTFWENLVSGLKLGKGQPTQMRTSQITDELTEKACVVKFVFNKHLMESAQLLLRDANLSSQALFPGLEGVAKSISYFDKIEFRPEDKFRKVKRNFMDLLHRRRG